MKDLKNSTAMPSMEKLNQQIRFARSIPTNKWDLGKQREQHELAYKEGLARLDKFRRDLQETEAKFVSRGVPEAELENWRTGQVNQHIQLLELALTLKQNYEWCQLSLRDLLNEKIRLLSAQVEAQNL